MFIVGICLSIGRGAQRIYANYEYTNTVESSWHLADRASTIAQKSEYIDKFAASLDGQHLQGTNANLFLQTPQSAFDENRKALQSLQNRLRDISKMDESSFAYQTAIQQITAQEQGEAKGILDSFESCWMMPTIRLYGIQ